MQYVPIQPDITILHPVTDEPMLDDGKPVVWTHEKFVLDRLTDPKLTDNFANIQSIFNVKMALKKRLAPSAAAPEYWAIEDTDHAAVKTVIDRPTSGYNPLMALNLLPFMSAWCKQSLDEKAYRALAAGTE